MCGNLGLLLGEDCAFSAEDAAEAMTRVVAMRGAQSYGFWRATPSQLSVHLCGNQPLRQVHPTILH